MTGVPGTAVLVVARHLTVAVETASRLGAAVAAVATGILLAGIARIGDGNTDPSAGDR